MSKSDLEHYALLQSEAVFAELPTQTLIEVAGGDRASFLHNLCTNDVKALQPNYGCEAFFTTVQGKTLLHGILLCESESISICAPTGYGETILPHLDKYLIREDVQLSDRSGDFAALWLAGEKAAHALSELNCESLTDMLSHRRGTIAGEEVLVVRVPFAVTSCYLLLVNVTSASAVAQALAAHAQQVSDEIVQLARIDALYPEFGTDISDGNLPQEVDRNDQAISFTKGCYLGQETVARIDALGHVNRQLVKLHFPSVSQLPEPGTKLTQEDKEVGEVTSTAWSSEGALALGYVRAAACKQGTTLGSEFGSASVVS